jgi:hypothetical protein
VPQAEIRQADYLPYSNGVKFDQIQASGGGILTALHIAYSLSLIDVSLDDANVLLPAFLIIDSPRKAIGQTYDDAALSLRIYKRLISLAGSGRIQLIVADNDLPQDARTELEASAYTIEDLDYGLEAMVPGVSHQDSATPWRPWNPSRLKTPTRTCSDQPGPGRQDRTDPSDTDS